MQRVTRDEFYEYINPKDVLVAAQGKTVVFSLRYGGEIGKTVDTAEGTEYWLKKD